jgi:hypothetical protein
MVDRSTPNDTSAAVTRVSCSKGADPFRLKSYRVSVNDGKWLKKDSLAPEKFSSLVMLLFAQVLILLDTAFGKSKGRTNNKTITPPKDNEKIFNAFQEVLLNLALSIKGIGAFRIPLAGAKINS